MAVTISGISCAEGYTDVAVLGSQLGDPVLKDIGCIPLGFFGDLSGEAACNVFYEPAIDEDADTAPASSLGNYTAETLTNGVIPIVWNNTFQKQQKLPADTVDGVPYDIANTRLEALAKANARANGQRQLACLFNEGTKFSYGPNKVTKDNVLTRLYDASEAVRRTGANPTIAVVSPEFYTAMKLALPNAIDTDELNSRMITGNVGIYDGIRFVESPYLGAQGGTIKYNTYSGAPASVEMDGVDLIMWDGSKFAAINKLFDVGVRDGGAAFPGVAACYAAKLGVKLLEHGAAYCSGTGNTSVTASVAAGKTFTDSITIGLRELTPTIDTEAAYKSIGVLDSSDSNSVSNSIFLGSGNKFMTVEVHYEGEETLSVTFNGQELTSQKIQDGLYYFSTVTVKAGDVLNIEISHT